MGNDCIKEQNINRVLFFCLIIKLLITHKILPQSKGVQIFLWLLEVFQARVAFPLDEIFILKQRLSKV